LSFAGAIEKINADFGLGIPIERRMTLREQSDAERKVREIAEARERETAERHERDDRYNAALDELIRLDKNRTTYAPQAGDEELNPLFVEALHKLDYQDYIISTLL
jgi:hypothetical protein